MVSYSFEGVKRFHTFALFYELHIANSVFKLFGVFVFVLGSFLALHFLMTVLAKLDDNSVVFLFKATASAIY